MLEQLLAINGHHDASITCLDREKEIRIFEYERFTKKRYCSFTEDSAFNKSKFLDYIRNQINTDPTTLVYSELNSKDIDLIQKKFPTITNFSLMGHHMSHSVGGFVMSGFKEALVISLDGGGQDYEANNIIQYRSSSIYKFDESGVETLTTTNFNTTFIFNPGIYGALGHFVRELNTTSSAEKYDPNQSFTNGMAALSYAGKLMGLAAYGKVREDWIPFIEEFYCNHLLEHWSSPHKMINLKRNLGFADEDYLFEQDSYDLATTNQYVFEKLCLQYIMPFIEQYNLNVIFTGGCALNVLFNQKLKQILQEKNLDLYIPPNPGDCGLSYGHFLTPIVFNNSVNKKKFQITPYSGFEILDYNELSNFYKKYKNENKVSLMTTTKIVELITNGKIGAILQGRSEVGPRALGNRSIICDPSFATMKDTLNKKVKFREWFRPFAPVCQVEDKDLYFDNAFESEYMSYAPVVKEEFRKLLPAITHIDNTARLQTVTKEQHELFYSILSELKQQNKIPIILNTSFNIKGKPILTTIEDAFYVLENTELDFLIIEQFLFEK